MNGMRERERMMRTVQTIIMIIMMIFEAILKIKGREKPHQIRVNLIKRNKSFK